MNNKDHRVGGLSVGARGFEPRGTFLCTHLLLGDYSWIHSNLLEYFLFKLDKSKSFRFSESNPNQTNAQV